MSKLEFLLNLRVARNLWVNQLVMADSPRVNPGKQNVDWARAAIWLTPSSVAHFNVADFPELGEKKGELQDAVLTFRSIAKEIAPNQPATIGELEKAEEAFKRILELLEPYLATHEEGKAVEAAIQGIQFPDWVVSWDYELGNDSVETPSVWLKVYSDEEAAPRGQLGRVAYQLTQDFRERLTEAKINRWPYVRLQSAQKHMVP